MLRLALEVADTIVAALPARAAYALADFAGDLWHRFAPARRRLVAANLARVCAATGRPTRGPEFSALVRSAFRNHARYYVELLRAPHYRFERMDEHVEVPDADRFLPLMRDGPAMLLSSHLGNFEPFGMFVAAHGLRPLSPVEEIEPRALFEFMTARRGASHVDIVPLGEAGRAIVKRLRSGGIVGIIADRDLAGDGQPVTIFGHPTTLSAGPGIAGGHPPRRPDRRALPADRAGSLPRRGGRGGGAGQRRPPRRRARPRSSASRRASRPISVMRPSSGGAPSSRSGRTCARDPQRRRARQGRHAPAHAVLGRDGVGAGACSTTSSARPTST